MIYWTKETVLMLAWAIALVPGSLAGAQTPKDIAKQTFPSVVLITMDDANHQPLSLGTGFFVAEGVIATNLHVIEGAASGTVKLVGDQTTHLIRGTVGIDARHDLALLSIDYKTAPSLPMTTAEPAVGDTVFVVGNPHGLEGTFSQGIVSGIRYVEQDKVLQITAPVSPGSSGGPVLNTKGEVIGVAVASVKSGQNLNFAIPVGDLMSLMDQEAGITRWRAIESDGHTESVIDDLGGDDGVAVSAGAFDWNNTNGNDGGFSISIRNHLQDTIFDVVMAVIFFDESGQPIQTTSVSCISVEAGEACRAVGRVHRSVKRLTTGLE